MSILAASVTTKNLPQQVLRWQTMVESECAAQGVSELVPYVLGIIMVESGGDSETTPDIMQSSESQGWPMNTIKNPKDSIHYGVMHLKGSFADAKKYGITDLSAIVQTYNFGRAYIRWLASNNKQHSLQVADQYSKTVVAPSLGNTNGTMVRYSHPIAVAYNGGYRYKNGGNFFYAEIVKQYVDFNGGTDSKDVDWTNVYNPTDGSIGVCWNKYGEGAGVNIYSQPRRSDETYKGVISDTIKYRVYGEVNGFYGIGKDIYIQTEHVNFTPYVAVVTPVGGVNTYKGAIRSGDNYMQTLEPSTKWVALAYRDGWWMVGNDEWIPNEYVMIQY